MIDSSPTETNRLGYIWCWLALSLISGFIAAPLLTIEALMLAPGFSFFAFFTGVALPSAFRHRIRLLFVVIFFGCALGLGVMAWRFLPFYYQIAGTLIGLASLFLGMAAYYNLPQRRKPIFVGLFAAYFLGMQLTPVGSVLLAVLVVLYVDRWQDQWSGNQAMHAEHSATLSQSGCSSPRAR